MRKHRLAIAAAVVHTLVLAAFTFPAEWVPTRLWYWSQAYSRVFFHQDWRLFAPDPPACSCSIEMRDLAQHEWHSLDSLHDHFVWDRMTANLCRFAEMGIEGDTVADVPIAVSMTLDRMVRRTPDQEAIEFRLHRKVLPEGTEQFIRIRPPGQR